MSESPAAPRPVEIELKYRLREEAAGDRYLLADELAGFLPITPVRSTQLEDRYLDRSLRSLNRVPRPWTQSAAATSVFQST